MILLYLTKLNNNCSSSKHDLLFFHHPRYDHKGVKETAVFSMEMKSFPESLLSSFGNLLQLVCGISYRYLNIKDLFLEGELGVDVYAQEVDVRVIFLLFLDGLSVLEV